MLEVLFGSRTAEQVLMVLHVFESGYASSIAGRFEISLSMVQKQLNKFEEGGILVSRKMGRTRMYEWNPRYAFMEELRSLLQRNLDYLPDSIRDRYYKGRSRPRRRGKP
ncbi:MAG TPA: ArsR family transcriptional regulator [Candidatus Aminicenantes bacterium]|nr:ArsR family transcriptional regulator [Candidatus Aminicenantes bacterium]